MSTERRPLEIVLSEEPDWEQFDVMVIRVLDHFDARVLEANDGLDERCWDLEIDGHQLKLLLQQNPGITLGTEEEAARPLLKKIGAHIGAPVR
ncbi:MAG: DUF3630 family protein [Gemmataceae bacterium]